LALRFSYWSVTKYPIRHALREVGYTRCVALARPPLSEDDKKIRLQWAEDHVGWERWRWERILWSDETWITGGKHRRKWITRLAGGALDDTCLVEKVHRKRSWMFWACFSGREKGPCLFSEKECGSINKERCCERIVPLVHGWMRMRPGLVSLQDGARGHSAALRLAELEECGIHPIFWPAFSPDIDPVEVV
jgi:transposase